MKRIVVIIVMWFLSFQVFPQSKINWWGDTASEFKNHRVKEIVPGPDGKIYVLSVSTNQSIDKRISFSALTSEGKLTTQVTYYKIGNIYDINTMMAENNGMLRFFATQKSNGVMVPYINEFNPDGSAPKNSYTMVNVPEYVGDAIRINPYEYIWSKSIRHSATGIFNIIIYRMYLEEKGRQIFRLKLESTFNEECSQMVLTHDSNLVILAKRYLDDHLSTWLSVIYMADKAGNLLWTQLVSNSNNFKSHSITVDHTNNIYYAGSYTDERYYECSSQMVRFDKRGNKQKNVQIDSIETNKMLVLKDGNILLLGCNYDKIGQYPINKARTVTINPELGVISSRQMDVSDRPDSELPSLAMTAHPTNSEFLAVCRLPNGNIVAGGYVQVPVFTQPAKIIASPRIYKNILVFIHEDGSF